jgi:hypothetical protein
MKKYGLGFYLGCVSAVLAVVALISCAMVGGLGTSVVLLVVGILLFAVTAVTGNDLIIFASYLCYLCAGWNFLSVELFTISNLLTAIDATTLPAGFVPAAVSLILTGLVSLVSTVPALKKAQ